MNTIHRINKLLSTSMGRDKVLKSVQYSIRLALHGFNTHPTWMKGNRGHLVEVMSGLNSTFSGCRTVGRLGMWLEDVVDVVDGVTDRSQTVGDYVVSLITNIMGFVSDISEDLNWLGDKKVIPEHIGETFGFISDLTWAGCLVFDIYFALIELGWKLWGIIRGSTPLTKPVLWQLLRQVVDMLKLTGDMIVALTYAFDLKTNKGLFAISGLVSGLVSLQKLWAKTASK